MSKEIIRVEILQVMMENGQYPAQWIGGKIQIIHYGATIVFHTEEEAPSKGGVAVLITIKEGKFTFELK